MARNTQTVLTDESNLARVIDAAGGSWYVESLTEAMADAAWVWFQELEAAGGLVASLQAGLVHERLAATWAARSRRLATRAEPITGISEFPLVDEIVSPVPPTALPVPAAAGSATTEIAPLPQVRRSEGFEALRAAADDHTRRHGTRPTVVLVGLGTPADHNARSGFAKNLFEAGGVATVLVERVAPEDLAATVAQRGATVACLCSSDARYPDLVPGAAAALKAGGVTEIYLAGKPGDHETAWAEAGVDRYVFAGCDALDVLGHLHERLGIQPVTQAGEETP
jgi:methylmalonyl-CoA mutase